jgi:hypothetical protein
MPLHKKNLSALFAAILILFVSAAYLNAQTENALFLKARTIQTSSDFDAQKIAQSVAEAEVFQNRYYRIVQFRVLPMPADKAALAALGVQFLDYIPNRAYILSLPKGFDYSILKEKGATAVEILRGGDKMCEALRQGIFPDYAQKTAGTCDLVVRPFANVTMAEATKALSQSGFYTIGQANGFLKTITVRISKQAIPNLVDLPFIQFVDFISSPDMPEDEKGRQNHRGNLLNNDSRNGLRYDGSGFGIAIADDGIVGPHIDFHGRVVSFQTTVDAGTHGDMTAGVALAAGNRDPTTRSGASGATFLSYQINNYPHFTDAIRNMNQYKTFVTSTSYGQGTPGQAGCNRYDNFTVTADNQIFQNPRLIHVFSAGNSGTGTCIGVSTLGNITGGYKLGKNVLAVANLDTIDRLQASSSRGPSVDGRIKPDISAVGTGMVSTGPNNQTLTGGAVSGTSAACPGVAAVVTQLYHAFSDMNGGRIAESALLKAAMLNTADDLGQEGPDYLFGWGRVNAYRAFRCLKEQRYIRGVITPTDSVKKYPLSIPANLKQAKVMVYWHDPAGSLNTSQALVNDLDLTIKNTLTGETHLPYILSNVLEFDSLRAAATRGIDRRNNMEQVQINSPTQAHYDIEIKPFALPSDSIVFYIVYEFFKDDILLTYPNGGESVVPRTGETIRWDAISNEGNFSVEFSADAGATWRLIREVSGSQRHLSWVVPDTLTGKACVRVRRIIDNVITSDVSDSLFTIVQTVPNFRIQYICPDTTFVAWSPVAGAVKYELSQLGQKFMDSVATTTQNQIGLRIAAADSAWFSIKALLADGGIGRRAIAISKPRQGSICPSIRDLQNLRLGGGLSGTFYNCGTAYSAPLSISLRNYSTDTLTSVRIGYQINNGTPIEATVSTRLLPDETAWVHTSQILNLTTAGTYNLKIWAKRTDDAVPANDTLTSTILLRDKFNAPLVEPFDNHPFPPAGWRVAPSLNGQTTWAKADNIVGSTGAMTSVARLDGSLQTTRNTRDTLLTWLCDMRGVSNARMLFDISYAVFNLARSANLSVVISTDCGQTFKQTEYSKFRTNLASVTTTGIVWTPSRSSHWRRDTVNLAAYKDSIVQLGFVFAPENDNRLYLDNINIEGTTNAQNHPLSIPMLSVYPNPSATGLFELALKNFNTSSLSIKILDAAGKQISEKPIGSLMGDRREFLNLQNQASGIYLVRVQTDERVYTLKLTKL